MLIVCPNCSTSYAIDPTSLGSAGRIVRCARRKTTWFADGAKPEPELTAVEAETYAERAFTGVLRPDHPVNSSGVEVEHRPVRKRRFLRHARTSSRCGDAGHHRRCAVGRTVNRAIGEFPR